MEVSSLRTDMKNPASPFHRNVFINCPFDADYWPLFHSIVFTVHLLGFRARCTLEMDAGDDRYGRIVRLIGSCKYGIHDLSRIQQSHQLPRFNMPFELGLDMGFKSAGCGLYRSKNHLIMESHQRRSQKFISDLSGRDIKAHSNRPGKVIGHVRNWLNDAMGTKRHPLPGGDLIFQEYQKFQQNLGMMCENADLQVDELTFNDFSFMVAKFIAERYKKTLSPSSKGPSLLSLD